jgi:type III restriction enzyme
MSNQLLLAKNLSEIVNQSRENGEMIEQVTPTTQELLKFWFDDAYCDSRQVNFHE